MRRIKSKKNIKMPILVILLLISSLVISFSYARYISEVNSKDQVKVAKFGELTLVEKMNGEVQSNNFSTISDFSYDIISGCVIDKEVYVEFTDSEISTYLFLVIDAVNWSYDDILNKMMIINNKSNLLSFSIDNTWSFLEEASTDGKFVFYYLVDVNGNNNGKYNVMNQIDVGFITAKDEDKINNSNLRFSVYGIQKNNSIDAMSAWNYLNL